MKKKFLIALFFGAIFALGFTTGTDQTVMAAPTLYGPMGGSLGHVPTIPILPPIN